MTWQQGTTTRAQELDLLAALRESPVRLPPQANPDIPWPYLNSLHFTLSPFLYPSFLQVDLESFTPSETGSRAKSSVLGFMGHAHSPLIPSDTGHSAPSDMG